MLQDLLLPEDFLQFDNFKSTIELCEENSFFAILGTEKQNLANALQDDTALLIDDLITLKPSTDAIHEILKPYRDSNKFIFLNLFHQKNDEFIKDLLFYRDFISDYKLKIIILVKKSHYKNLMKTAIDLYNIATFSYLFLNYEIELIQEIDTSALDNLLEEYRSQKGLNKKQKAYYFAEIGRFYDGYGEITKSLSYYNKALQLSLKIKDRELEVRIKLELSNIYRINKQFSMAKKYLLEAKIYFKNKSQYLSILNTLFLVYLDSKQFEKASLINIELHDRFTKTKDDSIKLIYLEQSLRLYQRENNIEQIELYWNKTYNLAIELHNNNVIVNLYQYRVVDYIKILNYKKALIYLEKSIKLYKIKNDNYMLNLMYLKISFVYHYLNIQKKARIYANFCYKYFNLNKLKKQLIEVNHLFASIYATEENYSKAIQKYEEALKISRSVKDYGETLNILLMIASVYNQKCNYDKVLETLNEARDFSKKIKENNNFYLYAEYANLYKDMGEIQKAYSFYNKAIKSKEKLTQSEQVYLDELYGEILMEDNKLEEALVYFDKCLKLSKQRDDLSRILSVEENLGFLYKKMGNTNMSRRFFMEVIHKLEVLNIKAKRVKRLKEELNTNPSTLQKSIPKDA